MKKTAFRLCLGFMILLHSNSSFSFYPTKDSLENLKHTVNAEVRSVLQNGEIPGMAMVVLKGDQLWFKNYGYSDETNKSAVTKNTLFQIGSCSKAFTALALIKLFDDGLVDLDENVSRFIPWLKVYYKNNAVPISIRQLMSHTSGIPWNTIAKIPETGDQNALEKTVRTVVGIKLHAVPGEKFEYATINYDILALVIERITKKTFEAYLEQEILRPLKMNHTFVGARDTAKTMSKGYKIGFFKPRLYEAPVYKGNNAAGYVVTSAADMAKWLRYQMGLEENALTGAMLQAQRRDETVAPIDNNSYAAGWYRSLHGDNLVFHGGRNPNFTAFIGFDPVRKFGVIILANSNSASTEIIGKNILNILAGKEPNRAEIDSDNSDRTYSVVALILAVYVLVVFAFIGYVLIGIWRGNRVAEGINAPKAREAVVMLLILIPFLYGLYKLPNAMAGFTWSATWVWMPQSFFVMILLVLISLLVSYLSYFLTFCFPDKNNYRGAFPKLILISAVSGIANMILILLITSAMTSDIELKFKLFYFGLVLAIYLMGRRFVQIKLIKITRDLIYNLRVKLIDRIFKTSYQRFEKIDTGRIYTAFNDDVGTIGESTNMFIMLITNLFTATAAMLYLASVAFWATALILLLITVLSLIYYFVSRNTRHYFEEARDNRTVFIRLINGVVDGYKEISLHLNKKMLYKSDVSESANEYRVKMSTASILYVNASMIGEIVLVSVLGTVVFGFPFLFPGIPIYSISVFVVILLYLIGPVNAILQSVPAAMRLNIAWNRVQQFLKDIPANNEYDVENIPVQTKIIRSLRAENLRFRYEGEHQFDVGPINLEVNSGEILFIIGGNGSGKTTLAKLLTGLYEPTEGKIYIDDREEVASQLGEKFSAVFNPLYLFEKLYNIKVEEKRSEITKYLELLHLQEKVRILDNGTFSTINLSGGQRKRLALLLCYLEDSPIYLFDEWAADQDPEYRKFFYRTLLPEMRNAGKIVIAITHDDHYFDIADRVIKMNQGKLEEYHMNHGSAFGY